MQYYFKNSKIYFEDKHDIYFENVTTYFLVHMTLAYKNTHIFYLRIFQT